jgi:serpin B
VSHRSASALTLLAAGVAAACGSDVTVARSRVPRNTAPQVEAADRAALVAANTAFALDLYRVLRPANPGNLFYSPYSISIVLTMTAGGARGQTESEMLSALRHTLPQDRLHAAFNWTDLQIGSRSRSTSAQEPPRLSVANSLWGQGGMTFNARFLDLLAEHYDAGMQLVDFRKDAEQARRAINDWVSGKTADKIKDLMAPGAIDSSTRLVLVNAIYFKAAWQHKFLSSATRPDTFRRLDGSTGRVEMMSQTEFFRYAETDFYQAVELPYDGAEVAMLVVLPAEGRFEAFAAALGRETLDAIVQRLRPAAVRLQLPKFTHKPDMGFSLRAPLEELGMRIAFQDAADLGGITDEQRLKVADCVHKGFIAVNEDGTEAAAATGVSVVAVSGPPTAPTPMRVDRPFLLMIRDVPTGTLLFVGGILDPRT